MELTCCKNLSDDDSAELGPGVKEIPITNLPSEDLVAPPAADVSTSPSSWTRYFSIWRTTPSITMQGRASSKGNH